ncbi:MAG: hypothetical protein JXA46_06640 [Dehalococcoidales bacterium]|nr:hypothetical protein [Dehalococcoidales bacterium]
MIENTLKQAEELAALATQEAGSGKPAYSVVPLTNHTRPGTEGKRSVFSQTGQVLKNAPSAKGDYFKVSSILE